VSPHSNIDVARTSRHALGNVDDHVLPVGDLVDKPDRDDLADDLRLAPSALEDREPSSSLDTGLGERLLQSSG